MCLHGESSIESAQLIYTSDNKIRIYKIYLDFVIIFYLLMNKHPVRSTNGTKYQKQIEHNKQM